MSDDRHVLGKVLLDEPLENRTYYLTSPLDLRKGRFRLRGGPDTILQMEADGDPILLLGGTKNHISDLALNYANAQPIGATDANAVQFYAVNFSVLERLTIYRANRGMFIAEEEADPGGPHNWVFSTSFRDITVVRYSNEGINLTGYQGGISGNLLDNIFLLGRDDDGTPLETNAALVLGAWGNGHLRQINVEGSRPTEAIYLNNCSGTSWDSVHFESIEPSADYSALMHFAGGVHSIRNVDVQGNTVSVSNSLAVFRGSVPGTKIDVSGLHEADNTVTTPNWRIFFLPGDETGCYMRARNVKRSGSLVDGYTSTGVIEIAA